MAHYSGFLCRKYNGITPKFPYSMFLTTRMGRVTLGGGLVPLGALGCEPLAPLLRARPGQGSGPGRPLGALPGALRSLLYDLDL